MASEKSPIDRHYLARFTQGDVGLEREILSLFATQITTLLDQLSAVPDKQGWTFLVHSLKGAARSVGAWQLAQLAEGMERADPDGPARAALVTKLRPIAERTVACAKSV